MSRRKLWQHRAVWPRNLLSRKYLTESFRLRNFEHCSRNRFARIRLRYVRTLPYPIISRFEKGTLQCQRSSSQEKKSSPQNQFFPPLKIKLVSRLTKSCIRP